LYGEPAFIILDNGKPISKQERKAFPGQQDHILGLSKGKSLGGALTAEQVAVSSSLLHHSGVNSIALLEDLLGRSPLANEAGDPRGLAGFLVGLGDAVEEVGGGDGAAGDVEAALLSGHGRVSQVVVGH
jgi:hypothetical protein